MAANVVDDVGARRPATLHDSDCGPLPGFGGRELGKRRDALFLFQALTRRAWAHLEEVKIGAVQPGEEDRSRQRRG